MSLVAERAGRVHVRVGGNTQETARLVQSLDDGKAIEKQKVDTNNPVRAPSISFSHCMRPRDAAQAYAAALTAIPWRWTDTNARAAVYARDPVPVGERLVAREREVVLGCPAERLDGHPARDRAVWAADPGRQPHRAPGRERA